ncbi:MAG TPA: hypothetical protein PLY45_04370 [bacterium]|nr:hypothetical protein [bacterium]
MADGIDILRPGRTAAKCDPSEACCPDAQGLPQTSSDEFVPEGAAFAAALAGKDFFLRGLDRFRSILSKALDPAAEAPKSPASAKWIEELPLGKYMAAIMMIDERLESLPQPGVDKDLAALVDLAIDNIEAVVTRLEEERWFAELPDEKKELFRQKAVEELKAWMGWESFRAGKFSDRGRITVEGAALVARMTAPIVPVYPPAGAEKFDPYLPLEPTLEPTVEKIAELLRGSSPDEQEAHRRAAWALLEAQRILKSQPWIENLSIAERDARFHELKRNLVSSLSSERFRQESINSDGFVKIGALKGLVDELAPHRIPREAPPKAAQGFEKEKGKGKNRAWRLRLPSNFRK